MDWILRHKLVSIIIVLVISVAAWYFLSGSSSSAPPVLAPTTDGTTPDSGTGAAPASAPAGAQDLVNSLLALRAVSLSGAIFSDPSFQALQDFTTPVQPEPVGRTDPFAPLGSNAQSSTASTNGTGAQINFAPQK